MFLRLLSPRIVIVCLDGLIDLGDLTPELRKTIKSMASLDEVVGVSYRRRKDVDDWLSLNPLGIALTELVCRPGAWVPPPISEALKARKRQAWEAIAVCADSLEVAQAHTEGVGAILVSDREPTPVPHKQPFTTGPDFIFHAGEDASNIHATEQLYAGYVGEVLAAAGLVPWLSNLKSAKASTFDFENQEAPEAPVQVCGRYFSIDDPRYPYHPLSLRLINAKKHPERQAPLVSEILAFWVKASKPGPVLITCIPPRPGGSKNVVGLAIDRLKVKGVTSAADLMEPVRDYPKQKEAGSPESRRDNVRGVFKVREGVRGQKVVVVDDITTSFATLNEARSVLLEAGAAEVIPMAIGFHPRKLEAGPRAPYPSCEKCGKGTMPLFRKADGKPFFGCSNFERFKIGERHPGLDFRDVFERALRST